MGQFALMFAVAVLGIACRDESKRLPFVLCGLVFFSVSVICGIAGVMALGRNLTPFPKSSVRTQLVQRGIYSLMRHPLYVAVLCGSVGWALVWQSWPGFVAALVLALFLDAKARREERWLREQFSDYADYERRVRRFIPWIY